MVSEPDLEDVDVLAAIVSVTDADPVPLVTLGVTQLGFPPTLHVQVLPVTTDTVTFPPLAENAPVPGLIEYEQVCVFAG